MRKIIILAGLVLSCSTSLFAQKIMTRTGKVSFFSSTSIENIEAFNNEVAAAYDVSKGDLVFQIAVKGFKFEKQLMQEHFNEDYMESSKFPKASFAGKIADYNKVDFKKNGSYKVVANGTMTIHGVNKSVSIPGTIDVKDGVATFKATFNVATADYNIKIPSIAEGKIAKSIAITVNAILK
ncbi:YceI family protein [Taibaiella lutea]|uniref:YceI family protein n=1 Tax=Taibaiella lutea TaxID=2608001 RepID=A0A5M6CM57_9BACT|nr:YceI family protein [Taibaiella lutea]KAA5536214.1 YceI family protein [Taibaiella lutea]